MNPSQPLKNVVRDSASTVGKVHDFIFQGSQLLEFCTSCGGAFFGRCGNLLGLGRFLLKRGHGRFGVFSPDLCPGRTRSVHAVKRGPCCEEGHRAKGGPHRAEERAYQLPDHRATSIFPWASGPEFLPVRWSSTRARCAPNTCQMM